MSSNENTFLVVKKSRSVKKMIAVLFKSREIVEYIVLETQKTVVAK